MMWQNLPIDYAPSDLQTGDRIAIFASNEPLYITALYSIWWAGLVAVPINAKLHHDEVSYIFSHAEIKLAFFNDATQQTIHKAASQCEHEVNCINIDNIEDMMEVPAKYILQNMMILHGSFIRLNNRQA